MKKKADNARKIDGILLLDKPQGRSSNAVLQVCKRLFTAKKAGHTGSLDPLATGMLPICFGEATKFSQYLLDADKCYESTGLLGIKTDSSDATGHVIQMLEQFSVNDDQLLDVIASFRGAGKQIPSMFSALKHNGNPLYKYAREGIEIERPARDIFIKELTLNSFDGRYFSIRVQCSKGTYIRNLVEDIGDQLKTGAHVTQLHRCYTAGFEEETMYGLEALEAMTEEEKHACLLPIDKAVSHFPRITLEQDQLLSIIQGRTLTLTPCGHTGSVRIYDQLDAFMGMGELNEQGLLKAKRLLAH